MNLTSYVGGARYPELAGLPPEKLVEVVLADLRVLLGVKGKPVFVHTAFCPRAIPQYNVGYGKYRELLDDIERRVAKFIFRRDIIATAFRWATRLFRA